MKLIEKKQREIIQNCKQILKNEKKFSLFSYFAFWEDTIGYSNILFNLDKLRFFPYLLIKILKELYFSSIDINFKLIKNSNLNIQNYKKIIFVNASANDFDNKGKFIDRYFQSSPNKNLDYLYFILYESKVVPKKLSKNILLLKYNYIFSKKYNFLGNIIKVIINLYKFNFNYKKVIDENSLTGKFTRIVPTYINNEINFKRIKTLLMSFEAQPYQIKILDLFKTKNKKIINICYDHSAPHALPIHMYYRFDFIDKLIINGSNQKKYLSKFLNWPIKKLYIKKSLRYQLSNKFDFKSKIFLPYKIFDSNKILSEFKNLLIKKPSLVKYLSVRNHPLKKNSEKHRYLIQELKSIIENTKKNLKSEKNNNKFSIFIGQTTAVIVALEKKVKVIHICDNPHFDMYSSKTWENLKVISFSNYTFKYELKKQNSFLKFTKNSRNKIIKDYE